MAAGSAARPTVPAIHQPVPVDDGALTEAAAFITRRLEQHLLDAGHPNRLVQAVLPLAATPAALDQTLSEPTGLAGTHRDAVRGGGVSFSNLRAKCARADRASPSGGHSEDPDTAC